MDWDIEIDRLVTANETLIAESARLRAFIECATHLENMKLHDAAISVLNLAEESK